MVFASRFFLRWSIGRPRTDDYDSTGIGTILANTCNAYIEDNFQLVLSNLVNVFQKRSEVLLKNYSNVENGRRFFFLEFFLKHIYFISRKIIPSLNPILKIPKKRFKSRGETLVATSEFSCVHDHHRPYSRLTYRRLPAPLSSNLFNPVRLEEGTKAPRHDFFCRPSRGRRRGEQTYLNRIPCSKPFLSTPFIQRRRPSSRSALLSSTFATLHRVNLLPPARKTRFPVIVSHRRPSIHPLSTPFAPPWKLRNCIRMHGY